VVDPRTSIIHERLKGIDRIVAVTGGKGGVGKSLTASTLALALSKRGFKVGLFDLDFTSPSTHIILGIGDAKPKEDKGIVPVKIHGLHYMSIVYYSGDYATPLRGADVSNALIELLSITRWEKLDYLILDMPPGIGDTTLDLIRLIKNIEFVIVTTPSQLAFETARKLVSLLVGLKVPILGMVENMKINQSDAMRGQSRSLGLVLLAEIPFDTKVEEAIGDLEKLQVTMLGKKADEVAAKL
jgi:ATP-binding protein involved in chromosome partitioning